MNQSVLIIKFELDSLSVDINQSQISEVDVAAKK